MAENICNEVEEQVKDAALVQDFTKVLGSCLLDPPFFMW